MLAHYALSEILIVLAAIAAGWVLLERGDRVAAVAVALICLAALFGAIRYGAGLVAPLEPVHRFVSQVGGLASMLLLLLSLVGRTGQTITALAGCGLLLAALGLAIIVPASGVVIVLAAVVASTALLVVPKTALARRVATLLSFTALVAVGSPLLAATGLGSGARWHVYHMVVAAWVALLPFCLWRPQPAA